MASSTIASRVIGDDELRQACAAIYAAVVAVPQTDRMDVTAVALRALVDTNALAGAPITEGDPKWSA